MQESIWKEDFDGLQTWGSYNMHGIHNTILTLLHILISFTFLVYMSISMEDNREHNNS